MGSFILPRIDPLKADARFPEQSEPLIFIISVY
jgi:hypothetical protein